MAIATTSASRSAGRTAEASPGFFRAASPAAPSNAICGFDQPRLQGRNAILPRGRHHQRFLVAAGLPQGIDIAGYDLAVRRRVGRTPIGRGLEPDGRLVPVAMRGSSPAEGSSAGRVVPLLDHGGIALEPFRTDRRTAGLSEGLDGEIEEEAAERRPTIAPCIGDILRLGPCARRHEARAHSRSTSWRGLRTCRHSAAIAGRGHARGSRTPAAFAGNLRASAPDAPAEDDSLPARR